MSDLRQFVQMKVNTGFLTIPVLESAPYCYESNSSAKKCYHLYYNILIFESFCRANLFPAGSNMCLQLLFTPYCSGKGLCSSLKISVVLGVI